MGSILSKPEPDGTIIYYYCITYQGNVIYVGRTLNFQHRMSSHRSATNNPPQYNHITRNNTPLYKRIREIGGWDQVSVKCLETRSCKSREEIGQREQYWIDMYKSCHLTNRILFIGNS